MTPQLFHLILWLSSVWAACTAFVILFLMGACPDSEQKRQEDWEALEAYIAKQRGWKK